MLKNSGRLHQISICLMHTEMNDATDMKPTSNKYHAIFNDLI